MTREGIPMICRLCKRPTGYIITQEEGVAQHLAGLLNKITSICCEKCFEENQDDDKK